MSSAAVHPGSSAEYYCPICEKGFALAGECPTDGNKLIRLGASVDPLLGRDLDAKYTILEKLGQGGMGAVYRAEQRGLGREVAIKVIHAQRMSDAEAIKRFLREAKLASRLGHPNIVGVIDFGQTDDGLCYLVMELVNGRTLGEVIASEGVLEPARLVRIAAQICDALERAHALQIVHRDLKPSNAMLLAQGRDLVKILDFGLAKSVASDDATSVTTTGALLGTPAFLSPELALGQPCDGRADLYSLGVMLYLLGSGRLPFQSSSPHELISLHGSEPAPPMTGVSHGLAKVIDRLLRKDPAERYPTAAAVREALERALADSDAAGVAGPSARPGEPPAGATSAPPVALPSREARAPGAGRTRRWLAPAIVGALVAVGVGYLVLASGSPPAASGSPPPPPPPSSLASIVDASAAAPPPPADAAAPVPVDAVPPVPVDAAGEAAGAADAGPAPPTRPGRPRPPTRLRPKAPRPAAPPSPPPAGSPAAKDDDLPF